MEVKNRKVRVMWSLIAFAAIAGSAGASEHVRGLAAPDGKRRLEGEDSVVPVDAPVTTAPPPPPPPPPVIPVSSSAAGGWGYPISYATPELISYDDIELFPRWVEDPDTQIWEYKVPIPDWDYSYTFDDPDGTCSHKCKGGGVGDFPYYGLDYCHTYFSYYTDNCMDYYHPFYHPWIFTAPPFGSSSSAAPPSSGAPPVRRDLCGLECKYDEEDHHAKRSPLGRYLLTDEGGDYHREAGACPPCPDRDLSSEAPPPPSSSAGPAPFLSYYRWWEPTWPTDDKKYCHFYYSVCGATVAYHLSGDYGSSSAAPPFVSGSFYHGPPASSAGGPPLMPGYTYGAGIPPLSGSGLGSFVGSGSAIPGGIPPGVPPPASSAAPPTP